MPKSEFEGIDPLQVQQAPFFQHPIGCGPFMVEEVNMKNYTILAPFDKYYNGVADFKIQMLPSAGDSDPNVVTRAKSADQALNRYLNGWAPYQIIACRLFGRTSLYQNGGAFGFRDQLQDVCAVLSVAPRAGVTGPWPERTSYCSMSLAA